MLELLVTTFEGWRDCGIVTVALLDCLLSLLVAHHEGLVINKVFHPFIQTVFLYLVPLLLAIHYLVDGFRWQLYPLYCQLVLMSIETRYNLSSLHHILSSYKKSYNRLTPQLIKSPLNSSTLRESNLYRGFPTSFFIKSVNELKNVTHFKREILSSAFHWVIREPSWLQFLLNAIKWLKVCCIVPSLVFCFVFPVPRLPKPIGTWGCGVEEMQFLADHHDSGGYGAKSSLTSVESSLYTRHHRKTAQDSASAGRTTLKKFQCLVFYPIEHHRYERDSSYPWLPSGKESLKTLGRVLGLPVCFFRSLLRLRTHSVMFAPLSKRRKKYPIVFLSHAIGFTKTGQTMLCEALASNGSIVVSVEHSDGTALPTISDNSVLNRFSSSFNDYFGWISLTRGPLLPNLDDDFSLHCSCRYCVYRRKPHDKLESPPHEDLFLHHSYKPFTDEATQQISDDMSALSDLLLSTKRCSLDTMCSSCENSELTFPPFQTQSWDNPELSSELQFRHTQLIVRVAELRAAYRAMMRLSETSGSWIKDRIDWKASSIVGFGFGGASALLTCICDCIEAAKRRGRATSQRLVASEAMYSPRFQNCILLCPWLDAVKELELRFSDLIQYNVKSRECSHTHSRLPQNILLITTTEQLNEKFNNKIRLLKLMKEATGEKILVRFTRCRKLDFTDLPVLSPFVFRQLGLSGPRSACKTAQMLNRTIVNFLNYHHRRSAVVQDIAKTSSSSRAILCQKRFNKCSHPYHKCDSFSSHAIPAVSEPLSYARKKFSFHSNWIFFKNKNDTTSPSQSPYSPLKEKNFQSDANFCNNHSFVYGEVNSEPSVSLTRMLHALKLAGVPDHYIRNLSGLRAPLKHQRVKPNTKEFSHTLASCPNESLCCLMEGVADFMDFKDLRIYQARTQKNIFSYPTFAEVCYL